MNTRPLSVTFQRVQIHERLDGFYDLSATVLHKGKARTVEIKLTRAVYLDLRVAFSQQPQGSAARYRPATVVA